MAKGGQYEREICWQLSRWVAGNSEELIFWRTSNSGGGATVRRRKGIKNKAHAGDITAIELAGRFLTDFITFELKRGYNTRANFHNLLDFKRQTKKRKAIPQKMYEEWIEQAVRAAETAGTPHWMLIHRRDGAEAMCFMTNELFSRVFAASPTLPRPFIAAQVDIRFSDKSKHRMNLVGMKWKHFLFYIDPDDIKGAADGS